MTATKSNKLILLLPTIIIGVLLIVSVITSGFNFEKSKLTLLSAEETGQMVIEYINENVLEGQGSASLIEIEGLDAGDLYKFKIDIDGQVFDSYVTRDGKLLFPQAIDLEAQIITQEGSSQLEAGLDVSVDDDPALGPEGASVVIIAFSDYECPYCAEAEEIIKKVLEVYPDKVRFVFRDFPLSNHKNAQKAAEASECADEQGKFWTYHDKLFANQQALSLQDLKRYAQDSGAESTAFNQCLDSGKYFSEVEKDLKDGQSYGVTVTPTFFINGQKLVGAQPFEAFKEIIDWELGQ